MLGRDAGGLRLPADVRPQQRADRRGGRNPYPRQDRPVPRIHPRACRRRRKRSGMWSARALCSKRGARRPLCGSSRPALERASARDYAKCRDLSDPNPDARHPGLPHHAAFRRAIWKGITVQFYLPRDESITHVGTMFHERAARRQPAERTQMRFAPNTGYAFAVDKDTWHSADPVGTEVTTRDSILLTYFVDAGVAALPAQPRQADRQFPAQRVARPLRLTCTGRRAKR